MTFTTTHVYFYKTTFVCLIVTFTNVTMDVVQRMVAG